MVLDVSNALVFSTAVVTSEVAGGDLEPCHPQGEGWRESWQPGWGSCAPSEGHGGLASWGTIAAGSFPGPGAGMEACTWRHRVASLVSQVLSEVLLVWKIRGAGAEPGLWSHQPWAISCQRVLASPARPPARSARPGLGTATGGEAAPAASAGFPPQQRLHYLL